MIVVICGVSGAGKTTVGRMLSAELGVPFFDADDFHSVASVQKMTNGIPLDDADRQPWLETLAAKLVDWEKHGGAVLACSALKEAYRETLGSACVESPQWVFLTGSKEVLAERLASREDHFLDLELLGSQLEALEIPEYGQQIDIERSPQDIVNVILRRVCVRKRALGKSQN